MTRAIQMSAEVRRVLALPRRDAYSHAEVLAKLLTEELRTFGGTMSLWDVQAVCLSELALHRGLLAPVKVSGGKTLISLLAPVVVEAKRPLLLVPAKLIKKTKRAINSLSFHFRIPNYIRIESYELLGRVQAEDLLKNYKPDLIVADECHKLKNRKAGVTRRVKRYIESSACMFVGLSGTISRRSLRDYAHLHLWAARYSGHYAMPFAWHELDDWCMVLDTKPPRTPQQEILPGALLAFALPEDTDPDPKVTAQRGYARRFRETPGVVVASGTKDDLACSLVVSDALVSGDCRAIDNVIANVRRTWTTPEGYALSMATQVWQHVTQMALGFHYRFKVRPPDEWFAARKAWAQFAAAEMSAPGSTLDTEFAVAAAFPDCDELVTWQEWRARVRVEKEAVWHCDAVLLEAERWLAAHPRGLCWVDYIEFGAALSARTGIPYFRENATHAATGTYIEDHDGPAICSVFSCSEGLNLQYKWQDNLYTSPAVLTADRFEQSLARTHRFGQEADTVSAEVLVNCIEHAISIEQVFADAAGVKNRESLENKLLYCDRAFDHTSDSLIGREGGRWGSKSLLT